MADNLGFENLTISDNDGRKPPIRNKSAKQPLLPVPVPTKAYMDCAAESPELIGQGETQPLMIVLDLNGALLYRKQRGTTKMIPRPNLTAFVNAICALKDGDDTSDDPLKVHPFVWSSATEHNVDGMVNQAFGEAGRKKLVAVWHRGQLRLGKHDSQNPQVYKQLSWIWEDKTVQESYPKEEQPENGDKGGIATETDVETASTTPEAPSASQLPTSWSQLNTILIDDSVEKGAAEPYNIVLLPEFKGYPGDDVKDHGQVLIQLLEYLQVAGRYRNVSAFVRCYPFVDEEKKWQALK